METQFLIAHRLEYIDAVSLDQICQTSDRIGRMLRGMIKSLQAKPPTPSP
jgi:hypothetical protein